MTDSDQNGKIMLIALGSNATLGGMSSDALIRAAIAALEEPMFLIRSVSRLYRSPAFPPGSGPDYVNAVVAAESTLEPHDVLEQLHRIEADNGRTRGLRWAARTLDLDLIAVEGLILPDRKTQLYWTHLPLDDQLRSSPDQLVLPHPRLQDRAFVLVPLSEVAPHWRHPVLNRTVPQMLKALPPEDVAALTPI